MKQSKFIFLSWWMLLFLVLVFILQLIVRGFDYQFALHPWMVSEKPWQFITAVFLHGGADHLLQNLLALGIFGILLEKVIGSWKWLAVFLLGGIAGTIAGFLFYPDAISLGASAGIMAIVGALATIRPRQIVYFGGPIPVIALAVLYIIVDFAGMFAPNTGIGHAAHLAGFAVGIIFGLLNYKKYEEKKLLRKRTKIEISEEDFRKFEKEHF